MIVISHNATPVSEWEVDETCDTIRLQKERGEPVLQDAELVSQYGWEWPSR